MIYKTVVGEDESGSKLQNGHSNNPAAKCGGKPRIVRGAICLSMLMPVRLACELISSKIERAALLGTSNGSFKLV